MPVTLLTARTEVRNLLDEAVAQFWSDAMINSWINQGATDIARQAQALWMQTTITAVPLQQSYQFPSDFLGVHRLDFMLENSDQTYSLDYNGIKNMDEIWGILHQLPAAYPNAFYIWNDTGGPASMNYFGTYPVVGAPGTFILYYYRDAIWATSDTQYVDVTPGYEDICYEYAIYKAKRRDRDSTWMEAKQLYDIQLQQMFDKTRRFTDQGDHFANGAGAQWPTYAYADDGMSW
jgi:hypothetical protein